MFLPTAGARKETHMKTSYIRIRLTPQEKKVFEELAAHAGMTLTDYIKYCCIIKSPLNKKPD